MTGPWTVTRGDHPAVCRCHSTHPRLGCEQHGPQPRERAVTCTYCARLTFNVDAVCDPCHTTLQRMAQEVAS